MGGASESIGSVDDDSIDNSFTKESVVKVVSGYYESQRNKKNNLQTH